ncbi:hypothetical protein SDC9_173521 [bioreactor metagenome]|uniref:Uncharacterized protein n=1 Tax=bioreactor metagenome TaxID=1076179 RepID=A0A645GGN7_9ZZZZ
MHVACGGFIDLVAHDALKRLVLGLWRVEQLAVHGGVLRAQAVAGLAVRGVPIRLGDVLAIHAGHDRAFLGEVVLVHTNENERGNDQQNQQEHHYL